MKYLRDTQAVVHRIYQLEIGFQSALTKRTIYTTSSDLRLGASASVTGFRFGFTVERSLAKEPNTAQLSIYNLSAGTRNKLHGAEGVPVVISAGYEDTGLATIFKGEMREAFSRPDGHADGTWITVMRAGDGDKALRKKRVQKGWRPGVSLDRVISDVAADLGVGLGNVGKELLDGLKKGELSAEGMGNALANGFRGTGSASTTMDKVVKSLDSHWSIQDGELQIIRNGQLLSLDATLLNAYTGLEESPQIDGKGVLSCRARILPGLLPGHPIEIESVIQDFDITEQKTGKQKHVNVSGLWRIDKARYIGDTHGKDWSVELECSEVRATQAPPKKKAAAK